MTASKPRKVQYDWTHADGQCQKISRKQELIAFSEAPVMLFSAETLWHQTVASNIFITQALFSSYGIL
jgi:hypothetical protein